MTKMMTNQNLDMRRSRLMKNAIWLLLVPMAIVIALYANVWAAVTLKTWTPGETLTAAQLNANFDSIKNELATISAPNRWFVCGTLKDLAAGTQQCELAAYHLDSYEYGMVLFSPEPQVVDCLTWNVGLRVVNRYPHMVDSDNPANTAMQLGGFIYYTGTNATDDDIPSSCAMDQWRHYYWKLVGGNVTRFFTKGCLNDPVYCRARR